MAATDEPLACTPARAAAVVSRGRENTFRKNWWRGCLVSQLLDYNFRDRCCTEGGKCLETLSRRVQL
jgi:hypothetical protein